MTWTPYLQFDHDPASGPGIFPSWYGGWSTEAQNAYGDHLYVEDRMAQTWEAARAGGGVEDGTYGSWQFATTAGFTVPGSLYIATAGQVRQIIQINPGGDMFDAIIDGQFQAFVEQQQWVKGVHYDTPPAASRYKNYDWAPDSTGGDIEVLPGGGIGLGAWDGNVLSNETAGYYGADLEIRQWDRHIEDLPAVATQVKEGTQFEELTVDEQGGWPGYDNAGQVLFSWPGFYPALESGDIGDVSVWSDADVVHDVDLLGLVDPSGLLQLNFTSNLFAGDFGLPPNTQGLPALVDGGAMNAFGANSRSQFLYLRVVARAYPKVRLPRIRFWTTNDLLLRWLNHVSPLVWQWLFSDAWLSIRLSMTRSYY